MVKHFVYSRHSTRIYSLVNNFLGRRAIFRFFCCSPSSEKEDRRDVQPRLLTPLPLTCTDLNFTDLPCRQWPPFALLVTDCHLVFSLFEEVSFLCNHGNSDKTFHWYITRCRRGYCCIFAEIFFCNILSSYVKRSLAMQTSSSFRKNS